MNVEFIDDSINSDSDVMDVGNASPDSAGSGTNDSSNTDLTITNLSDDQSDSSSSDNLSIDFSELITRIDQYETTVTEQFIDYTDNLTSINDTLNGILIIFVAFCVIWVFRKLFQFFN